MTELAKSKVTTILIIAATVILAGVAVFTALRLYKYRFSPIAPTAPESQPSAWDCKNYTFSVSTDGVVSVRNNSTRDEPSQQAKVYINGNLVATLDVPSLTKGQSATLGTVQVPSGTFSWRVVGTKDCSNEGSSGAKPVACKVLNFKISRESTTPTTTPTSVPTSTPTPSYTPTPTTTPIPTETPIGEASPTPTQALIALNTSTPTPTKAGIAASSPTPGGATLPEAGFPTPTLISLSLGLLVIIFSILLAF